MGIQPDTENFIQEWLNHFSIPFDTKVRVKSKTYLDYYIAEWALGVLIIDWKRPISVQVVNKAVMAAREKNLQILYLVAKEISEPAKKTLQRYGNTIVPIHPNGLSEIAVKLSHLIQEHTNQHSIAH